RRGRGAHARRGSRRAGAAGGSARRCAREHARGGEAAGRSRAGLRGGRRTVKFRSPKTRFKAEHDPWYRRVRSPFVEGKTRAITRTTTMNVRSRLALVLSLAAAPLIGCGEKP